MCALSRGSAREHHIQAWCRGVSTPPRRRKTSSRTIAATRSERHRALPRPALAQSSGSLTNLALWQAIQQLRTRSDGINDAMCAHFSPRTCCCTDRPTKRAERPAPRAPRAARPLAATSNQNGRGAARRRAREQSSKAHAVNNAKRMLGGMGGELRSQDGKSQNLG